MNLSVYLSLSPGEPVCVSVLQGPDVEGEADGESRHGDIRRQAHAELGPRHACIRFPVQIVSLIRYFVVVVFQLKFQLALVP